MRPTAAQFEQVTGYRLRDRAQLDGTNAAKHAPPAVDVQLDGGAVVALSLDQIERMYASYLALRGPQGAQSGKGDGAQRSLVELRAHLNVALFDDSPFVVTQGEARKAHNALMKLPPAELNSVLGSLDDKMLNRYLGKVASAEPFSLEAQKSSVLGEFVTKLALELTPDVGKALVGRLNDEGKRRLLEGVLQLPNAALVNRLKESLGAEGFAALARGGKTDTLIGGGLIAGKLWKENITDSFKLGYAAATDNTLQLPAGAKDVVFLAGPGLFGDQLPGYLEPSKQALRDWGVPAGNVGTLAYNTADLPSQSADRIYVQIKQQHDQGKKVVVLGHSKFGRDMLEAFARHPDLKQMVVGAVMMQPALSANIARDLARPEMQKLLDPVLQIVGGNRGAFGGLSEKIEDLPPWPTDVPTVVYASSTESCHALLHAGSAPYYQGVYNAASDGAVAFQDQTSLNGAYLVTLPGLADHAQPGLTFSQGCEHFAQQVEAGAPDDVVKGMLSRLRLMAPKPELLDGIIALWLKAHDTPSERARCVGMLRQVGPVLDRAAKVLNKNEGYPLVDNTAMTKALVAQLFERIN